MRQAKKRERERELPGQENGTAGPELGEAETNGLRRGWVLRNAEKLRERD